MEKKYKLLQDYITPFFTLKKGIIKTDKEWIKITKFDGLNLFILDNWFEEVKEVPEIDELKDFPKKEWFEILDKTKNQKTEIQNDETELLTRNKIDYLRGQRDAFKDMLDKILEFINK